MNGAHDKKLEELHQIRQKANEEIKVLSIELGKQQGEISVLILETRKYESQLEFLAAERDMILQAQMQVQSSDMSPDIQLMSLDKAEKKAELLEQELTEINSEWIGMISQVEKQTEHFMNENEMKEF